MAASANERLFDSERGVPGDSYPYCDQQLNEKVTCPDADYCPNDEKARYRD
jgi:hypothetical protein